MNIAIDGYEANVAQRVGIGRYAYEIITHLYPITKKHNVTVFLPEKPLPDMPKETTWWHYQIAKPKTLWTFFGLPSGLSKDKPDVVFSPTHYLPRFVKIPRACAVMDLSYLRYPEMFRRQDLVKLTSWTAYAVRQAKRILTISEFSKNDIIKTYGVSREKVVVTYPGMNKQPKSVVPKEKKYILSVGTIQPRKNYVRLIEAFSTLVPKFPDLQLVIVGKKGWLVDETLGAPRKFGVEKKVVFLHNVTDGELQGLYKNAKCFVLVSLYEGFGLPVAEAMVNGCPVVVSNVSSLPEIAGEAGIFVDPESVESISQGLTRALTENNQDRVEKGIKQVKKFSWEKAARQTLDVLTQVGKGAI